jgi:hypothetical protein
MPAVIRFNFDVVSVLHAVALLVNIHCLLGKSNNKKMLQLSAECLLFVLGLSSRLAGVLVDERFVLRNKFRSRVHISERTMYKCRLAHVSPRLQECCSNYSIASESGVTQLAELLNGINRNVLSYESDCGIKTSR